MCVTREEGGFTPKKTDPPPEEVPRLSTLEIRETGRYRGWDFVVLALAVALVAFLTITMDIRSDKAARVDACQQKLQAISQAQQSYLVAHGKYAEDLFDLYPFLSEEMKPMSFLCPITGKPLEMAVQGNKYLILAPYTEYSINTGDPSW